MNKFNFSVIIAIIIVILSSDVGSEKIEDVAFRGYVADETGLFNSKDHQTINNMLRDIEKETSNQVYIAIINGLEGKKIDEFTFELANRIRIGQRIKNNGVLIVLALKDRMVRIEVGYGLENVLTDSIAGSIIDEQMIPFFKKGDFRTGMFSGVKSIRKKLLDKDIKEFFSMKWDIDNFENFISKYPLSILKCDALMFLGRFYEDLWSESLIKKFKEDKRKKSIDYYMKYLNDCPNGIWKVKVEYELSLVKNRKPNHVRYLANP